MSRSSLEGKVVLVTGASRGIGAEIAKLLGASGARVGVLGRTKTAHSRLPGTIDEVAAAVIADGGEALAVQCDVCDPDQVRTAVRELAGKWGGIDAVVNNAGYLSMFPAQTTGASEWGKMLATNVQAPQLVTQHCFEFLARSDNPHVLNICPPLGFNPRWYEGRTPYTVSKVGMSLLVQGWAMEFARAGIAANGLWPKFIVDTAAIARVGSLLGGDFRPHCRRPRFVAEAARVILTEPSRECTGRFMLDEEVLRTAGWNDDRINSYNVGGPTATLVRDLYVGEPYAIEELQRLVAARR
jgi:citronellol/citronellal dehydrogenase